VLFRSPQNPKTPVINYMDLLEITANLNPHHRMPHRHLQISLPSHILQFVHPFHLARYFRPVLLRL
jgi:hypothetical protein